MARANHISKTHQIETVFTRRVLSPKPLTSQGCRPRASGEVFDFSRQQRHTERDWGALGELVQDFQGQMQPIKL